MKKKVFLITLSAMLFMAGCSRNEYVMTTPIASNKNIEAFQDSNPLTYDLSNEDSLIYVELDKWNHQTKNVFENEPLFDKLVMVEMIEQQKYPIFHVNINQDYLNNSLMESVFMRIVDEIAAANGYWNYEIRDNDNKISIRVYTDREKQEVVEAEINGARTLDSYRTNISGSFDAKFNAMTLDDVIENAITVGDLDQDGVDEYILRHENGFKSIDEYYVVRNVDGTPVRIGQIEDEAMQKYGSSNVRIVKLNIDQKPRIVVDLGGINDNRIGYLIFELENNLPRRIDQGLIEDAKRGYLYVDDIDNDQSYERIYVRNLNTIEPLVATHVRPFYKEEYRLLERSENFRSNNITKPEDFVKSFVELLCVNASGYNTSTIIREYVVSDFILYNAKVDLTTQAIFNDDVEMKVEVIGDNKYRVFNAWENVNVEVEIELFNGELKVKKYEINP